MPSGNCGSVCSVVTARSQQKVTFTTQAKDFFSKLFNTDDWPARWHCGTWTDFHGWLYIFSDITIGLAYLAIPLLLLKLLLKRKDLPGYKIFWLFIAFIVLCGSTHLLDAGIFWWPAYRFSALLRFATGAVSVATVIVLYRALPKILHLRSVTELEKEISKRTDVEEKLKESEYLLSHAARISRTGAWDIEVFTDRRSWSKEVYDIYGLPYDYPINDIDPLEFFAEPYQQQIREAMRKAYEYEEKWDLELVLITANHTKLWVRFTGEPIYDKNGGMRKIRGIITDIDKYKSNETITKKALDAVTQNKEQLHNFTHILSHNLRNHSCNISALCQMINEDALDEENAEVIGLIKNVSKSLNHTLEEMSQVIKVKESLIEADLLYFGEVIAKTLNALKSDIETYNIKIEEDFKADTIRFPALYLESIVLNLVSNAIKYRSPDRQLVIKLRSYRDTNHKIVLECEDNGIGINLDLHGHKIFGIYNTFHAHPEAHGVGLYMVKTQMESQGGSISVESELGKGSTFKLTFDGKN